MLTTDGSEVVALARRSGVRSPDAQVDGVLTEFKTVRTGMAHTLKHSLSRAKKQATQAVVDARDAPMTIESALHGIRRFVGGGAGQLVIVKVFLPDKTLTVTGLSSEHSMRVSVASRPGRGIRQR
jgi:hypothetical protein